MLILYIRKWPWLSISGFLTKIVGLLVFLAVATRATCPAHRLLFTVLLGEGRTFGSLLLCSVLRHHRT